MTNHKQGIVCAIVWLHSKTKGKRLCERWSILVYRYEPCCKTSQVTQLVQKVQQLVARSKVCTMMDATITVPSIHILNDRWRLYFHSLPLQLNALGAIIVVFPMMNILAEHHMLDFKALALVRVTLSKSFTYKLSPFPAYILDPSGTVRILNVAGTRSSSSGGPSP